MTGTTIPPAPAAYGAVPGMTVGAGKHLPPSFMNSFRVAAVAERLASYVLQPPFVSQNENIEFFQLCISLARGIDYAVANNEVPTKAQDLPSLMKQVCQRKSDLSLRAAIVVLMLSVKNACKIGWFSLEESKEIFALANEIESGFSGLGDANPGPSNLASIISTIMARFYPLMKIGQILASLDVKPGYGAFMADFHILKSTKYSPQEKILLFVAQTNNIETSACIISPQQANFLINGKGVERRTNVLMDSGPQLPTNVTAMLKFGTNLLQVVGQFNGHYIVVVAFMSMASSLEIPVLQDYIQSGIIQDSDSDIIEGPSRISLNCPISYTRIRTPVKGHSCKHLQCFDFSNFVEINSRRPSWRCPHCNQHVCYTDVRVDQNMVKVLREVGENVTDVIISADGSWSAVLQSDDNLDTHNNTCSRNKGRPEQQESTDCMNYDPVVLDLTTNDEEMDAASTDEIEDTKPLLSNLQSQTVATNLTKSSELNNTVGVNLNVEIQSENNFWSAGLHSNGAAIFGVSDARNDGGISQLTFFNRMSSPVLTDAISPAFDQGAEGCGCIDLTTSGQYSVPGNLQLQQSQFVDSTVNNEYGRLSLLNRNVNRTPIAVQAPPASSQTLSPLQRPQSSFNSLTPDIERQMQQQQQLRLSRSHMNTFKRPDMASSSLQHQSAAQMSDYRLKYQTSYDLKINQHCKACMLGEFYQLVERYGLINRWDQGCFSQFSCLTDQFVNGKMLVSILYAEVEVPWAREDEMWFRLGGCNVRFGSLEFLLITRLRFGHFPEDVDQHLVAGADSVHARYFGDEMTHIMHIFELLESGFEFERDDDVLKLLYVFYLSHFLLGRETRWQIAESIWALVEDLQYFESFPWGTYIYSSTLFWLRYALSDRDDGCKGTMRQIEKQSQCPKTINIYGFVFAVQMWAMELIPRFTDVIGIRKNNEIPRIKRWYCRSRRQYVEQYFSEELQVLPSLVSIEKEKRTSYFQSLNAKQIVGPDVHNQIPMNYQVAVRLNKARKKASLKGTARTIAARHKRARVEGARKEAASKAAARKEVAPTPPRYSASGYEYLHGDLDFVSEQPSRWHPAPKKKTKLTRKEAAVKEQKKSADEGQIDADGIRAIFREELAIFTAGLMKSVKRMFLKKGKKHLSTKSRSEIVTMAKPRSRTYELLEGSSMDT